MDVLTDLKAILHSKRANIFYLEKCRVMQKDERVLYLTEAIEWFSPQSEYRPAEYIQGWMRFWFDETNDPDINHALSQMHQLSQKNFMSLLA